MPKAKHIATEAEIYESRARRASVLELERMLSIGRRVLLGDDASRLARAFLVPRRYIVECCALAEAEERGCLASAIPMTVQDAQIAAGIEIGDPAN